MTPPLLARVRAELLATAESHDLTLTTADVDLITSAVTRAVLQASPQGDALGLTPRMRDVLIGIAAGEQMTDTARRLSLSRDTVRAHRRRLFHQLGARNGAHAVALTAQRKDTGETGVSTAAPAASRP
ncbi:helix-turn-helix transcriptional regulator [Streptomyces microflavus]|uniref:helix-turn-helix domain-containing protein n=1 Tax=Streptomyces microflavus TaxID=1919 RepID=UPI0038671B85|nr:helix-turn-helix transcriptional regulator [Streptomyces microflavus]